MRQGSATLARVTAARARASAFSVCGSPPSGTLAKGILGGLPGSFEIQCLKGPEGHAPLLGADAVLRDLGALAARADTDAKAGEGIVEDEEFALASGKGESSNSRTGEAHQTGSSGKQPPASQRSSLIAQI